MKILFCDWNGTLLDDMPIWDEVMRKTFLAFGVEPPTIADYFRELESGDYLEVYRKRGIAASRDKLNAIYEPAYEERLADAMLFPEVAATLRQLHENGVRLVLVTSQQNTLVVPLLNKFGIDHLFDERAFHVFDKKSVITEIAQRNGVTPDQCSFVGDSPSDIRHAKKAGITAIAFLGEHIPEELLIDADHHIHTFEEILNLF
ncbi:MAG: HAD family hydrolase [Candidatus Sungbacteria bacterium]|nr:HAD family hydrolase [Candidatus Sungbacteria bacterium]